MNDEIDLETSSDAERPDELSVELREALDGLRGEIRTRFPARERAPVEKIDWMAYYPSQGQTGDPPEGFYDYLRYLWVADGQRGWDAFGEPVYTTREAWLSFVSTRRMRRYR